MSSILTDDTRRQILQLLLPQEQPVSVDSVAQRLSLKESGDSTGLINADGKQKIKTQLHHIHLPKLAENGLVTYNENAGTVAITDHSLYNDLRTENRHSRAREETPVMATLENHLRREALRIVTSARGPISRDELARAIASREADGESVEARIAELSANLHHIHLPKLEESGLVTYDHVEGTIAFQSSPEHNH